MKRKSFLICIVLLLTISPYAMGQLQIKSNGRAVLGKSYSEIRDDFHGSDTAVMKIQDLVLPTLKTDTITMLSVLGPLSENAGGRISFGSNAFNITSTPTVLVGEYGTIRTAKLWLHGSSGIYLTKGNGETLACYDKTVGDYFQFNCDVRSTGVFVASDKRFKHNIQAITNTSGLRGISAVKYQLNSNFGVEQIAVDDNAPVRFGFIAQEVEEVYPELVRTDSLGYKYVDYIGMIPLLVDALNEMKSKTDSLENCISELRYNQFAQMDIDDSDAEIYDIEAEDCVLFQNTPNPFSASTEIRCTLPSTARQAYIYVYDLQGSQKLSKEIMGRGKTSVTIGASELQAGMYIYTLVVDGKEMGSKRMILTN